MSDNDSFATSIAMEMGNSKRPSFSGDGLQASGEEILPIKGDLSQGITCQSLDPLPFQGADTLFAPFNNDAPFAASVTSKLGQMANYLGTQEAQGDNLKIEQVSDLTNIKSPTLQTGMGEGHASSVGMFGGRGG